MKFYLPLIFFNIFKNPFEIFLERKNPATYNNARRAIEYYGDGVMFFAERISHQYTKERRGN